MSNCFNKLQAAHFNQLVKNNQQKNYVCQLKKQVEIEKKKNESQASKVSNQCLHGSIEVFKQ